MKLYSKLVANKPSENLFYSPASIYAALAMTYAGAKSNTAKEMEQVMNWNKPEIVHEMTQKLFEAIFPAPGECSEINLSFANRLWAQQGYAILKEYTDTLQSYYQAEMGTADFIRQPEEARKAINQWVEQKTNDKIKDLIKDGILKADTRLVLTNAIYFHGFWENQFKKADTRPSDFKVNKSKTIKVKMMNKTESYWYGRNEELSCQVLKLPYKKEKMAMMILLPDAVNGLAGLENKLTAEHLRKCIELTKKEKVKVSLPKFKMNCKFEMKDVLSHLGIHDLFLNKADLSGITGNKELYVFKVIHQAFVDVNEEGTEAAAATAVVMTRCIPRPPTHFLADHPFLFAIQDCASGAILFVGRVVNAQ